jgi:hypothetical protein
MQRKPTGDHTSEERSDVFLNWHRSADFEGPHLRLQYLRQRIIGSVNECIIDNPAYPSYRQEEFYPTLIRPSNSAISTLYVRLPDMAMILLYVVR